MVDAAKNEQVKDQLAGPPKTAGYRAPLAYYPAWYSTGWGNFTLGIVDSMKDDPVVKLALGYKKEPIAIAEFEVQCPNPAVKHYIEETLHRFWSASLGTALEAMDYGFSVGENIYDEEDGLLKFNKIARIHPRDAIPWDRRGVLDKVQVNGVKDATGPVFLESARIDRPSKCWWMVYDAQYHPYYGRSILRSPWWPWRLKTMEDGGMEIIFKWAYKHSLSCQIIRHPDGLIDGPGGTMQMQDLARVMIQNVKSGSVLTLNSDRDDKGNYLWDIQNWAKVEGRATELLEYIEFLNKEIMRGLLIPDEVIAHHQATGGYSRSQVAMTAFFVAAQRDANHVLEVFLDSVLKPSVKLNFGDVRFTAKLKPILPPDPQAQAGMQGQATGAPVPGQAPPGPEEAGGGDGGGEEYEEMDIDTSRFKQLSLARPEPEPMYIQPVKRENVMDRLRKRLAAIREEGTLMSVLMSRGGSGDGTVFQLPSSIEIPAPQVTVNVPETVVHVHVPEQNHNVTLQVPEMRAPDVHVTMPPADVHVHVPEQPVILQVPEQKAPQVTVNVPEQKAPKVTVNVPEQKAPVVNVAAPNIKLEPVFQVPEQKVPEVTVQLPEVKRAKLKVRRDKNGDIEEVVRTTE